MRRLRIHRPSPALVVATVALFVALGGSVWAASRIDGRSIKAKSLPGNRVIVGSLPGNRLRPGTIGGNRINSASLGQVPSAAHADAADRARTADTAIHAQAAADATTVNGYAAGCIAGTRYFAGACWQNHTEPAPLTANQAAAVCARAGGELPRVLALQAFGELPGQTLDPENEWSGELAATANKDIYTVAAVSSSGVISFVDHKDSLPFRCVLPLLH